MRDMEQNGFDRGPLQQSSIDRRLSTIAGYYRYAHIDGRIQSDPAAYVRRYRLHDKVRRGLDRNELASILFTAERLGGDRHVLTFLLALNGLRVSEACGLNVDDLGMERGHRTVTFVGKGTKPAVAPITPRVGRAIDVHLGERTSGPILRRKDGNRLDRRTAYGWVRSIGKRAGVVVPVHPHMLRAGFIMTALDAGVPLRDVQIAARHSDPRTTAGYDHRRVDFDRHASYNVVAYLAGS